MIRGLFDYRDWSIRRAAAVGAEQALQEATLVFGRSMVRGFVLACVPRWPPMEDDEDLVDDGNALPSVHDPDRRPAMCVFLHIGAFFWVWARHRHRRVEMASSRREIGHFRVAERPVPKPAGPDTEWTVPTHLRGPSNDDIYEAIIADDVAILPLVIRPAIPWNLIRPGIEALEADAAALDAGLSIDALADGPLWRCAERPNGWPESWGAGCAFLRATDEVWDERLAWIDRRLRGEPMDADVDVALVARAWTYG